MNLSFEKFNLRKKFLILSSIIMVVFAFILSGIYYGYMKKIVMQDALEKSKLILQEVEAIRDYVILELRPRMYELHGEEDFILEAMSTTYVSMRIMRLFQEKMEGYNYRRVSQNPHNPDNATNEWEDEMFDWFEADKNRSLWQGQVDSETGTVFVSIIPDYIKKECLDCHGDANDAPAALIDKYGNVGGFRFSEGDLAGLNSVSIPLSNALARLGTLTGVIFLMSLGGSLLLLFVVNILFDKLVVSRLAWIVDSFGDKKLSPKLRNPPNQSNRLDGSDGFDELDTLQASFLQLNRYVRSARRGDTLQPNFIGRYAVGNPVTSGVMSWLYRGIHSETQEDVLLKIPHNNLYVNPLYRACLQTELKIMQSCSHRNLIKVRDRIEDVLILQNLQGRGIMNSKGDYDDKGRVAILSHLFDLIAYLHTNGIVHHDLRPENFFIIEDGSPIMIDLGLAHWHKLPDTLFDSGIGPQGDFRYMAPEQIKGTRGDSRSDVYSLGVMLFNIYTGSFPYSIGSRTLHSKQEWLKIKGAVAQNIEGHELLSSTGLSRIILKATAFDIRERYQWVEDMRNDFNENT